MSDFIVEVQARDGGNVLRPTGALDHAAAEVLLEAARCLLRARPAGPVQVDVDDVTFIDAHGLRALVVLHRHGFSFGGTSAAVRRVVEFVAANGARLPWSSAVRDETLLEQAARRHDLVAERFEALDEPERARNARRDAAACRAAAELFTRERRIASLLQTPSRMAGARRRNGDRLSDRVGIAARDPVGASRSEA